jgi:serine/threonine protein kinase/tetratricopeptide (TPR) repeat protein
MNELDLFTAALALIDPAERAAYLDLQCAGQPELRRRLDQLLAAHDRGHSPLDRPAAGSAPFADTAPAAPEPPETASYHALDEAPGTVLAGRYRLLEPIGEGGMGTVWMAQQTGPVKRRVAIKLIKAGMGSRAVLARFEAERQALALMDHPNIARVFDAGATPDGRPFFVMELVNGLPLTRFCDEAKLTPRERLELFVPVCQAVQHAHTKGIVHRDLKPSNVLVTLYDGKPVPKVIDFGVAKATGGRLTDESMATQFGAVIGTLEYMAPEQAGYSALDVDTRADIYSLGVVLYELLTGLRPFDARRLRQAALDEVLRILRQEEPPRPSARLSTDEALPSLAALRQTEPKQLTALMRGELDWIVMRCLEKSRERRYETASSLARDIDRYLADEPVEARPTSTGYRLRKLLRRNRGPAVAVALVLLALLGGALGTTIGMVQAQRAREAEAAQRRVAEEERDEKEEARQKAVLNEGKAQRAREAEAAQRRVAEEERKQAEAVAQLLESVFHDLDPRAQQQGEVGVEARLVARLDRVAVSLEQEYTGQPLVRARLRNALGHAQMGLGEPGKAIVLFQAAAAERKKHLGEDHPGSLTALNNLATAYLAAGQRDKAMPLLDRIGRHLTRKPGLPPQLAPAVLNNIAFAYKMADRAEEAIKLLELVYERMNREVGPSDLVTLTALNNLALACRDAGRTTEAIRLFEQGRRRIAKKLGPDHHLTLVTLNNLALTYLGAGRNEEAIRILEQVRQAQAKGRPADHPDTLSALHNLALAYRQVGRTTEAIRLFEQVREKIIPKQGEDHPHALMTLHDLALAYRQAGRGPEAIRLLEQVYVRRARKLGPDHRDTRATREHLMAAYVKAGRAREAIPVLERERERVTKKWGPSHPLTLSLLSDLALVYRAAGQPEKAVAPFEEALRGTRARRGEEHVGTIQVALQLADTYREIGRLVEAQALFEEWSTRSRKKLGPDHAYTRFGLEGLARTHERARQFDQAATVYRELLAIRTSKLPAASLERAARLATISRCLLLAGKADAAEPLLRECLAIRVKKQPDEWGTFNARSLLGGALLARKNYAAAEPLLIEGYEGLKKREGKMPAMARPRLAEALERLVRLYEDWGKKDKAEEWRKKAEPPGRP